MCSLRPVSKSLLALLTFALLFTQGCGRPEMPETFPVKGKVVYENGQPVPSGMVQFQSQSDQSVLVNGGIQPDGTFTLSSVKEDYRIDGAIAGQHRVTVVPPMDELQMAVPTTFEELYTVKPDANENVNEFTFTIPGP